MLELTGGEKLEMFDDKLSRLDTIPDRYGRR